MAFYMRLQAQKGKMRQTRQVPRITHHANGPDVVFLEILFPHPEDSGVRNFFLTINMAPTRGVTTCILAGHAPIHVVTPLVGAMPTARLPVSEDVLVGVMGRAVKDDLPTGCIVRAR